MSLRNGRDEFRYGEDNRCQEGATQTSGGITGSGEYTDARADAENGGTAIDGAGEGNCGVEDWGGGVTGKVNHEGTKGSLKSINLTN